ncbi:MAG: hypothetical protein V5B33_19170 [Candidatus Accumulibacter sp. UW20]|jgi:hypothetical protein
MPQANRNQEVRRENIPPPALNAASLTLRGFGALYDMQLSAVRLMLQSQARAAAMFGLPDYSDMFSLADERSRRLFASGTEQLLQTTERTREALAEIRRHIVHAAESQTASLVDQWTRGMAEFGDQTEQGLMQISQAARRQAEEVERAIEQQKVAQEKAERIEREKGGQEAIAHNRRHTDDLSERRSKREEEQDSQREQEARARSEQHKVAQDRAEQDRAAEHKAPRSKSAGAA